MKFVLFALLIAVSVAPVARAQRFTCGFAATDTSSLGAGAGSFTDQLARADLLTIVANTGGRAADPGSLELVYDMKARQFQVVQKNDGTLVTVVYSVVKPQNIDVSDASTIPSFSKLRQGSLQEPGATGVVGTVGGQIYEALLANTAIADPGLFWQAQFSVLSPTGGVIAQRQFDAPNHVSGYAPAPSLIQGTFSVHGILFIPRGS